MRKNVFRNWSKAMSDKYTQNLEVLPGMPPQIAIFKNGLPMSYDEIEEDFNKFQQRIEELEKKLKKSEEDVKFYFKCSGDAEKEIKRLENIIKNIKSKINKNGYYDLSKACEDLENILEIAQKAKEQ